MQNVSLDIQYIKKKRKIYNEKKILFDVVLLLNNLSLNIQKK